MEKMRRDARMRKMKLMRSKGIRTGEKRCRKLLLCACLLAAGTMLSGCTLAVPQADAGEGSDQLIGAYITLEQLDLYDMDSFLQDHSRQIVNGKQFSAADMSGYQQKLYASIDKCGSKQPADWKVSFPGTEGLCFFLPEWTDENGTCYQAGMYDDGISEINTAYHTSDTEDEMTLTGTIYVTPGAYKDIDYYLNPVYQTAEGDIYLMSGPSSTMRTDQGILEGEGSTLSIEHKVEQAETIGETQINAKTEKTTVAIKLAVMYNPVKITLCQMDAGHKVLKKETCLPQELPKKLRTQKGTAYILTETEKESPSGERVISRAVCEDREGEEHMLETFYGAEDGIILKKNTEIEWQ